MSDQQLPGRRRLGRPCSQHTLRCMGIKGAGTMNT